MVAAGVPAHVHDDIMQCGSMLPMPLPHAAPPAETCQVPVLMIEHVPHPIAVSLTPHAAPGSRRATDAIARMTAQSIASAHKSPQDPSKTKPEQQRGVDRPWNVDPPSLTHPLSH